MIFQVRHELTSYDLACAVALEAEIERDGSLAQKVWIGSLTKTDIREAGRVRVYGCGLPESWPEVEGDGLVQAAREHIDRLWPEGA